MDEYTNEQLIEEMEKRLKDPDRLDTWPLWMWAVDYVSVTEHCTLAVQKAKRHISEKGS